MFKKIFYNFNLSINFWQLYFRDMTTPKKPLKKSPLDDQTQDRDMTDEDSFDPIEKKKSYDDDDDDFDLPLDDLDTFDDFDDDDDNY